MRRDIILFDLDGTLTDSGPGIMKAGQYALRAFGIERDWRELSFFVGPPLSETFAHFVSAENVDAAVAKFREYYQQDGWLDNAPYPGIRFADAKADDQVRITTPAKACEIGSDYIVVGRPITQAEDPVAAYRRCVSEFVG